MPVIFQALVILHLPELVLHRVGLLQEFLLGAHPRPLEGGEGLGHEEGGAGHHLHLPVALRLGDGVVVGLRHLLGEKSDSLDVLHRLRGKSHHKIELHPVPAALEGVGSAGEDGLLREPLVDHVPQPVGAGLRREGQAALLHILDLAHHVQGEGVNPQGGKGDIDPFPVVLFHQKVHQPLQLTVIAGTQGAEGDLLVAGAL